MIQWLGLCAFTAEGAGSIPGWGTKIPQALRHSQKKKSNSDGKSNTFRELKIKYNNQIPIFLKQFKC